MARLVTDTGAFAPVVRQPQKQARPTGLQNLASYLQTAKNIAESPVADILTRGGQELYWAISDAAKRRMAREGMPDAVELTDVPLERGEAPAKAPSSPVPDDGALAAAARRFLVGGSAAEATPQAPPPIATRGPEEEVREAAAAEGPTRLEAGETPYSGLAERLLRAGPRRQRAAAEESIAPRVPLIATRGPEEEVREAAAAEGPTRLEAGETPYSELAERLLRAGPRRQRAAAEGVDVPPRPPIVGIPGGEQVVAEVVSPDISQAEEIAVEPIAGGPAPERPPIPGIAGGERVVGRVSGGREMLALESATDDQLSTARDRLARMMDRLPDDAINERDIVRKRIALVDRELGIRQEGPSSLSIDEIISMAKGADTREEQVRIMGMVPKVRVPSTFLGLFGDTTSALRKEVQSAFPSLKDEALQRLKSEQFQLAKEKFALEQEKAAAKNELDRLRIAQAERELAMREKMNESQIQDMLEQQKLIPSKIALNEAQVAKAKAELARLNRKYKGIGRGKVPKGMEWKDALSIAKNTIDIETNPIVLKIKNKYDELESVSSQLREAEKIAASRPVPPSDYGDVLLRDKNAASKYENDILKYNQATNIIPGLKREKNKLTNELSLLNVERDTKEQQVKDNLSELFVKIQEREFEALGIKPAPAQKPSETREIEKMPEFQNLKPNTEFEFGGVTYIKINGKPVPK